MTYSLYILKHPETNETIYVGITTNVRLRKNAHRSNHIREKYYYPIMDVLMTFTDANAAFIMEEITIETFKRAGHKLNNSDSYKRGYIKTKESTKAAIWTTIDLELFEAISKMAKLEKRSFSNMVAFLLTEAVEKYFAPKPQPEDYE